ncbi:MAG TPA: hypothetical protein VMJ32_10365 [Pirellulales bacterium]|nr:hypothetical protein [Pirellulales bacterium]
MNQQQDAIRPRHRRRKEACATGEAAIPRAQQCTRVLIRVPTVSSGAAAGGVRTIEPSPIATVSLAPRAAITGAATNVSAATGGASAGGEPGAYAMGSASAVPPPPVMTVGKQPGSLSSSQAWQQKKPATQPQTLPSEKKQLRIHAAHRESTGPHSAAPAWLEQPGQWVTGVLQRRSLLAFALIIAAAVGVALMFHNHAHHEDRSAGEPDGNAARQQSPYPADASSTPVHAENQNLTAYRDAAAYRDAGSSVQASGSTAQTGSSGAAETSWLSSPAESAQPPRWNLPGGANSPAGGSAAPMENSPAGANMPAHVETPPSQSSPNTTGCAPEVGQPSVYAARQERTASADNGFIPGVNGRISGITAFEGNINNPAQISR